MKKIDLKNKKVSILGMARSGIALARVLNGLGADILVSDVKTAEKMAGVMEKLRDLPLEWETGGHTELIYKNRHLVIISPGISVDTPILREAKKAGVPVISEVEIAYILAEAPFIAVTGTNGKSTTSTLIHLMLNCAGRKSFLAGNIGIPLVGEVEKIPHDAWITAEISSFQLEAVETFHPKVAVLTNITTDHIDRHGSFEGYKSAKANIFRCQDEKDFSVLNADDPAVMSLDDKIKSRKILFSRKGKVENGVYIEDGYIVAHFNGRKRRFFTWDEVPLKGVHNLENVLAASAVCLAADIEPDALLEALKSFKPLHYRMEYVDTVKGIRFYNDSKGTNPDAVRASLESFSVPVILIAGGTDKGLDFSPLAANIREYASGAVLIGQSRNKIAQALDKTGFDNYKTIEDMSLKGFLESMEKAMEMCPQGGVVMLSPSCASFDMFENAEHRGETFNKFVVELKMKYDG